MRQFLTRHRWSLRLFAAVACVYVISPAAMVGDSRMTLPTAISIYRDGDLYLDEVPNLAELEAGHDTVAANGHQLMGFPWPPALYLVPVVAVTDLVPGYDPAGLSISNPNETWKYELPMGALLTASAVVIFAAAVRQPGARRTHAHRRTDLVVPLVFAFSTSMWSSTSRGLSQHAAAAPFVALVVYLTVKSRTRPAVVGPLGLVTALAYIMRPTNAVLVVAVTVWVLVCHRTLLVRYLAWAAAAAVPFFVVNLVFYDAPMQTYYSGDSSGGMDALRNVPGHVAGLLVSPARGLLLFSPILVLVPLGVHRLWRARLLGSVEWLFLAIAVGLFSVAALWPDWWGGSSYGPRLLIETLPFLCWFLVPVADGLFSAREQHDTTRPRWQTRGATVAIAGLLATGLFVHSQGALLHASICWNTDPVPIEGNPYRLWDWSDPQPLRGVHDLLDGQSLRHVAVGSCAEPA